MKGGDKKMFKKCKCHKPALAIGLFMGGLHAIWALMVAIIPGALQGFLDWIFNVHFIKPVWVLTAFNFLDALFLIAVTFAIGYAATWFFLCIWKAVKVK